MVEQRDAHAARAVLPHLPLAHGLLPRAQSPRQLTLGQAQKVAQVAHLLRIPLPRLLDLTCHDYSTSVPHPSRVLLHAAWPGDGDDLWPGRVLTGLPCPV